MDDVNELKAAVLDRGGARMPKKLRRRVAAVAQRMWDEGESLAVIADALGVSATTAGRLRDTDLGEEPPPVIAPKPRVGMVPVSVTEFTEPSRLTMTSPSGWRVDGLGLDEVTALLRELS